MQRSDGGRSDGGRHDEIARRAYTLFEQRGRSNGHDLDDWLEAERQMAADQQWPGPRPAASTSRTGQRKERRARQS